MEIANDSVVTPSQTVLTSSVQTPPQNLPVQSNTPKKSRYKLIILLIIVLLLFVGIGVYYLNTQTNQATKQLYSKASPTPLKGFTNAQYNFGLNYPANWSLKENNSTNDLGKLYVLQFTPSDKNYTFYVTVLDNTNANRFEGNSSTQKEYSEWLSLPAQEKPASPSASKKTGNIKIDSIEAVQFLTETHPEGKQANYGILTWVRKNNINYYIGLTSDNSQTIESVSQIYSQILSSFKFKN